MAANRDAAGNSRTGSGRNGPSDPFWQIGEHYAREGIVSLAVNYMSNRDPENPEVMPTIEAALNYVKSQPDVDARQIALSGYCRGGGLTYMGLARFSGFTSGVLFHGIDIRRTLVSFSIHETSLPRRHPGARSAALCGRRSRRCAQLPGQARLHA